MTPTRKNLGGRPRLPASTDPRYRKRALTKEGKALGTLPKGKAALNAARKRDLSAPTESEVGATAPHVAAPTNGLNTENIGLTPAPISAPKSEPEQDTYFCLRCKGDVLEGQAACPICETPLDWAKVTA